MASDIRRGRKDQFDIVQSPGGVEADWRRSEIVEYGDRSKARPQGVALDRPTSDAAVNRRAPQMEPRRAPGRADLTTLDEAGIDDRKQSVVPLPQNGGAERRVIAQRPAIVSTTGAEAAVYLPQTSGVGIRKLEQRLTVIPQRTVPSDSNTDRLILPLPGLATERSYAGYIGFALCVLVPLIFATIYYGLIASNQYVTEFRFTVKSIANANNFAGQSAGGSLLGMTGLNVPDILDNYLVTDFLGSKEAVEKLQKRIDAISLYSKPTIDWWSRYKTPSGPIEKFVSYWNDTITVRFDPLTGIGTVDVRAFSPQDALLIANSLLSMSEELINRLTDRTRVDSVRFAQGEVERAQDRLKAILAKLTAYRDRVRRHRSQFELGDEQF